MKKRILVIIITVIWIYIGINRFYIGIGWLSTHGAEHFFNNLKLLKSGDDISWQSDKVLGIIEIVMKHHMLVGIIQMAIGVFFMVSAFYFLRLRAWARMALEITSWFWLILAIANVVFAIFLWNSFTPMRKELEISAEGLSEFSYMYNQIIYLSVFSVIILIAVILMIILLRVFVKHNLNHLK